MKDFILKGSLIVIGVLISSIVYGQSIVESKEESLHIPSIEEINKTVTSLTKKLSLSEEQKGLTLAIYKLHYEELEDQISINSRFKNSRIDALEAQLEIDIKDLLTDEQKVLYSTYLEDSIKPRTTDQNYTILEVKIIP